MDQKKYARKPPKRIMPQSDAATIEERLGEFISMSEAKLLAGYTQSSMWLNSAATDGKLKAIKKAGRWYTTVAWLNEYLLTVRRGNYHRGRHKDTPQPPSRKGQNLRPI